MFLSGLSPLLGREVVLIDEVRNYSSEEFKLLLCVLVFVLSCYCALFTQTTIEGKLVESQFSDNDSSQAAWLVKS